MDLNFAFAELKRKLPVVGDGQPGIGQSTESDEKGNLKRLSFFYYNHISEGEAFKLILNCQSRNHIKASVIQSIYTCIPSVMICQNDGILIGLHCFLYPICYIVLQFKIYKSLPSFLIF